MKVYGSRLSPYVARVWIQTLLKGLNEIEFAPVPGGIGSAEYKKLNPVGKIPALDTGSAIIPESEIICEYLEEKFPAVPLLPAEAHGRAQVRLINRTIDMYVLPPLSALLPQLRRPRADHDLGLIQDGWLKIRKGLAALEQFLGAGPYAFGASPTLADCAMVPMGYMIFRTMPELGVAAPFADYPRLDAWWANIRSNPQCAEALDWMAVEAIEFRKRREAEDAAKRVG